MGFFSKIKEGLKKTRDNVVGQIDSMLKSFTKIVDELFEKLEKLRADDVLVLSGSIPHSIDDGIYERIMERLDGRGIRIVVDATKDLLMNVLPYHPFMIKPNNHELGEMFGTVPKDEEEIIYYARQLQEKGAVNVLVSMAGDGAVLIAENGAVFSMGVPKGTVKNSVGAGDSMVAGFIAGYLENGNYEHALRLGSACGSASAFSEGLACKEDILKLYEELR